MKTKQFCLFFSAGIFLGGSIVKSQDLNYLYKTGEAGYSCFRIPSIITTTKGTVLAFAEARRNNCGDAGDIDLVVKRSADAGKTWSALQMVWNDSNNTCGNPAPIVDQNTGKIILLTTWNLGTDHEKDIINRTSKDTRRVFMLSSDDDGLHWSGATDLTAGLKDSSWTWYATGPGRGLQISKGRHKGRLVVSTNHITGDTRQNYCQAIFSDDAGAHWKAGNVTNQDSVNESTIAELSNGKLMMNMRNASKKRTRQVATSKDGGANWSDIKTDTTLIEPVCEGNLLQYTYPGKKNALLFCNPASTSARTQMTIRVSYNDGRSWAAKKLLYAGPSAYSCLTVLPNGNIGCFYEAGLQKAYEGIVFREISIEDINSTE
jgi:sialidase-1